MHTPQTWHHGLVAEWWANFNLDAPELDLYRPYLHDPILDAGCGAGRLLAPLQEAGHDVDGCDASADMLGRCRERAPGATLWVARLHELDPPRRYATIVVCGTFGLGSTRAQDELAIGRLHDALLPGGTLVLDNEVPYSVPRRWGWWAERPELPRPWSEEADRRTTADGDELALWHRTLDVDPLDQCLRGALRVEKTVGGVVVGREEHELTMRMWFRDEIVLAMRCAGFGSVEVKPGVDEHTLVYVATRADAGRSRTSAPRRR